MNIAAPVPLLPFVMQQVQTFSNNDAYQSRCNGLGNLGMGAAFPGPVPVLGTRGKHYKVHTNNAGGFNNFNYIHGDPEARAMTRIVFNGNGNRNDFHCGSGAETFPNLMAGEVIDTNTGHYQLNVYPNGIPQTQVNGNPNMSNMNNVRYMRQPMNPNFQGDNQMQRCYIQLPQGQQARFVRVQGSKMRPNGSYRNNFNNNQQRQKQNRRFITKVFNNNYKSQRSNGTDHPDEFFDEETHENSPNRAMQLQNEQQCTDIPEKDNVRKASISHHCKQEGQHVKSKSHHHRSSSSGTDSQNHSHDKGNISTGGALLEPKVEYFGDSMNDLSYDDITENSDDNEDSDLRERLMRKKHDQIIKREPGELDSDDEDDPPQQQEKEVKRKSGRTSSVEMSLKRLKSLDGAEYNEAKHRDTKKSLKSGRKEPHASHGSAYYHDNRSSPLKNEKVKGSSKSMEHKSTYPGSNSFHSGCTSSSHCCTGAEVAVYGRVIYSVSELVCSTNYKKQSVLSLSCVIVSIMICFLSSFYKYFYTLFNFNLGLVDELL